MLPSRPDAVADGDAAAGEDEALAVNQHDADIGAVGQVFVAETFAGMRPGTPGDYFALPNMADAGPRTKPRPLRPLAPSPPRCKGDG